ncbi:MAG: hypothetical protein HYY01_06005 [Chloroflexi bacterium]|nr:hypothetical protein [Chloroflexota bacterium]
MKHIFGKKVHLGRMALPVWAIALTLVMVAAVAGQAVGPVLSGSVQGSAGLVVSQTLLLKPGSAGNTVVSVDGAAVDDAAVTVNDEGTAFTAAIETQVGQPQALQLVLANGSGKVVNGILELNVPAGIDVDAEGVDDASTNFAQLNRTTYLFSLAIGASNDTADVKVTVESKDDAAPGFYTITGRIIQVAN